MSSTITRCCNGSPSARARSTLGRRSHEDKKCNHKKETGCSTGGEWIFNTQQQQQKKRSQQTLGQHMWKGHLKTDFHRRMKTKNTSKKRCQRNGRVAENSCVCYASRASKQQIAVFCVRKKREKKDMIANTCPSHRVNSPLGHFFRVLINALNSALFSPCRALGSKFCHWRNKRAYDFIFYRIFC